MLTGFVAQKIKIPDVALLLIDSVEGIGMQEKKLVGLIDRVGQEAVLYSGCFPP